VSQVTQDKTPQTGFQRYAVFNYCADISIITVSIQCPWKTVLFLSAFGEVWIRIRSTSVFICLTILFLRCD